MMKVIIVDDKESVRLGLKNCIEWDKLGLEFSGEAENGEKGIELFNSVKPDIVLTDICMPVLNGLEMIGRIYSAGYSPEFIILTGYDETEYIHEAMKYGVKKYLLKPIKNDELLSALQSLKKEVEGKRNINTMIKEHFVYRKTNFALDLYNSDSISDDAVKLLFQKYNLDVKAASYFVAMMQIDYKANAKEELVFLFNDKCKTLNQDESNNFYVCMPTKSDIFAVILTNSEHSKGDGEVKLRNISNEIKKFGFGTISVGVSSEHHSFEKLSLAKREAASALEKKAFSGEGSINRYNGELKTDKSAILDKNTVKRILKYLTELETEGVYSIINEIFESAENNGSDFETIKRDIIYLAMELVSFMKERIGDIGSDFLVNSNVISDISNIEFFTELKDFVYNLIREFIGRPEVCVSYSYSPTVQQVIYYVMLHYSENISVSEIAEQLSISPQHLMRRFKNEVDKTFVEFLSEYRIKKAVELMQKGNYKMYEISERVGYNDVKYFGKIFKKIMGVTPWKFANERGSVND